MKTKTTFSIFYLLISTLYFLFSIFYANGANYSELRFNTPTENLITNQEFEVKLLLYTDQPLNAYAIKFMYPKNLVELIGFNDAGSIIDIWQTQPQVSQNGDISLKGGSIKPLTSGEGLITTIKFKTLTPGKGEIIFDKSNVYLANGKGTEVIPGTENFSFNVIESPGGTSIEELKSVDKTPPAIEKLSVIEDPINTNQKLLSFIVKDNISGIEKVYYQTKSWLRWSEIKPALNPTAFSTNIWAVNFRVVDNQGNISTQTIYDWPVFMKKVFPIIIFLMVMFFIVINRIRKSKKAIINR